MSTNNKAINDVVDTSAPLCMSKKSVNLWLHRTQGKHILLAGLNEVLPNKYTEKSESILYFGEVVMCSYMLDMWC